MKYQPTVEPNEPRLEHFWATSQTTTKDEQAKKQIENFT